MFLKLYPTDKLLYIPVEAHHITALKSRIDMLQLSRKSLAGPGYIILNAIRVMNVVGLLAVITACILMLAKTHSSTNYFFFDALSYVITAITGMFLIVSELSIFKSYFASKWPLLSPSHGFVTLGCVMIVLGIDIMGNLNKSANSQAALSMPFWRVVISSGIIIFILGFINVIASFIFSDRHLGITARQVRADGAVAVSKTPITSEIGTPSAPVLAQSYLTRTDSCKSDNPFKIHTPERRDSLLPTYQHASSGGASPIKEPVTPSSRYSRATDCTKKRLWSTFIRGGRRDSLAPPLPVHVSREMEISAPRGVNPQFAHLVQRPDSALHPSRTGESDPYRWKP